MQWLALHPLASPGFSCSGTVLSATRSGSLSLTNASLGRRLSQRASPGAVTPSAWRGSAFSPAGRWRTPRSHGASRRVQAQPWVPDPPHGSVPFIHPGIAVSQPLDRCLVGSCRHPPVQIHAGPASHPDPYLPASQRWGPGILSEGMCTPSGRPSVLLERLQAEMRIVVPTCNCRGKCSMTPAAFPSNGRGRHRAAALAAAQGDRPTGRSETPLEDKFRHAALGVHRAREGSQTIQFRLPAFAWRAAAFVAPAVLRRSTSRKSRTSSAVPCAAGCAKP